MYHKEVYTKSQTVRTSKFELLRIVAMLAVIIFHYADHACCGWHTNSSLNLLVCLIFNGRRSIWQYRVYTYYRILFREFKINREKSVQNMVSSVFLFCGYRAFVFCGYTTISVVGRRLQMRLSGRFSANP